ncbi:MAG: hypothetical protein WB421_17165, partial [Terriglobales bacterium]
KDLTPAFRASGPHDFAVRLPRGSSARGLRPSRPVPTSVTTADVPSCGTGWTHYAGDLRLGSSSFSENRNQSEINDFVVPTNA